MQESWPNPNNDFFGKQKIINIIEFVDQFPDKKSCRDHMRGVREQEGVVCKNVMVESTIYIKANGRGGMGDCDFMTSLCSGTIIENSNRPFAPGASPWP